MKLKIHSHLFEAAEYSRSLDSIDKMFSHSVVSVFYYVLYMFYSHVLLNGCSLDFQRPSTCLLFFHFCFVFFFIVHCVKLKKGLRALRDDKSHRASSNGCRLCLFSKSFLSLLLK